MENPRHREIMRIIEKQGRATVKELSERLFVCEMTIRRDLAELEKCGLAERFRGGAACVIKNGSYPIKIRRHFLEAEKKELALRASVYIEDNSFVFIDSSSVCAYLVPHIGKKKECKTVYKFGTDHAPCGTAPYPVQPDGRALLRKGYVLGGCGNTKECGADKSGRGVYVLLGTFG